VGKVQSCSQLPILVSALFDFLSFRWFWPFHLYLSSLVYFVRGRIAGLPPTMTTNYASINRNTPYGSGDPYYSESTGYISPTQPQKKKVSSWIKFGIPLAVLVIAAAVLGGVLGSRATKNNASASGSAAAATSAIQVKNAIGLYPTGTDSLYMLPLYPATVSHSEPFMHAVRVKCKMLLDQCRSLYYTYVPLFFGR
jgi:hypothetical protein